MAGAAAGYMLGHAGHPGAYPGKMKHKKMKYKGMGGWGRHKFKRGGKFKRPGFGFKGKRGKRWGRGKWK
jgi:hypothetical protein